MVQSLAGLGPVYQMEFCGTGAVVIATEDAVQVVGKSDEFVIEEGRMILIPELDGVRLLSPANQEFLQRVPQPIEDVFKIGSMRAGSMLYEAYKVRLSTRIFEERFCYLVCIRVMEIKSIRYLETFLSATIGDSHADYN